MIRARGVFKKYADGPLAVSGVNVDVARGECLVVSGERGSGKSTLLRMLAALLRPTSGTIELEGRDVHAAGAAGRIHFADRWIDPAGELTVAEYLHFTAGRRTADAARRLELKPATKLRDLDEAGRLRVSCASALLSRRDVIVLDAAGGTVADDEPLREWIRDAAAGGSAVIVEADAAAAALLDARLLQLSNGRLA